MFFRGALSLNAIDRVLSPPRQISSPPQMRMCPANFQAGGTNNVLQCSTITVYYSSGALLDHTELVPSTLGDAAGRRLSKFGRT